MSTNLFWPPWQRILKGLVSSLMVLQAHIHPWSGHALRHIPDVPGKNYDIYDFSYCGKSAENRWNVVGERTLYLAKEKDVALAEFARHFEVNRTPTLATQTHRRKVYRFQVCLDRVLNLCDPQVWLALSIKEAPECFREKRVARATAQFIRNTTETQGIQVPSIAFLDNVEQWCLVLFLEKLPQNPQQYLPRVEEDGYFQIG